MTEKQGIDLSTLKGSWQAGGRLVFQAPVWRLLVVWLAVLTVAISASVAGVLAAPSDDDPAGSGPSLDGATFNPGQESMGARASSTGDGASDPWFVDPGEWYAPSYGPSAMDSTVMSSAAGDLSAWFTDPGEWYVASVGPSAIAINALPDAAGSYGVLRLQAAGSGAEVASNVLPDAAGSYGVLRLQAAGSGMEVASTKRPGDAAGSYGVLRLAARDDRSAEAALDYSEFRVRMAAGSPPGQASAEPADAGAGDEWLSGAGEYGNVRPAAAEGSELTGVDEFNERFADASDWSEVDANWFMTQVSPKDDEPTASAWFEGEAEWYIAQYGVDVFASSAGLAALSGSCAEQVDDPISGASSAGEAEYLDSQCSAQGLALFTGGGGAGRH